MSILGPNIIISNDLHSDGSNAMMNNLNMNNNKVINLSSPVNSQDAATKQYCDTNSLLAESNCLLLDGSNSMAADLNVNNNNIINLSEPVNFKDAATKNYIDTKYNGPNLFIGNLSGSSVTAFAASNNTSLGYQSLKSLTSGSNNTAIGYNTLSSNTVSSNNLALGNSALFSYTGANANTNNIAIGTSSLVGLRTGSNNTAIGISAMTSLTTGNNNIIIGYNTGNNYTAAESNNIIIGYGNSGAAGESNILRIGNISTAAAVITGIRGVTVPGGVPVYINSGSQLGTVTSSRKFKENIINAKNYDISKLRVVNFNYIDDATKSQQIGLVAEEVEELYPELIAYDEHNVPYTVKYMDLIPILLQKIQALEKILYYNNI